MNRALTAPSAPSPLSLISRGVSLDGPSAAEKREEIRSYLHRTMDVYEDLFRLLQDDQAFLQRPEPLRHPLIFYFGHTATFYVNKLVAAKAIARIDPQLEGLFAIGVDEMSWDDLDETHYDWPDMPRLRAYRQQVRQRVDALIDELDWTPPIRWEQHAQWAVLMAIEHERIHLETSSVLIRQLDTDWITDDASVLERWAASPERRHDRRAAPENRFVAVEAGSVRLGKARDHRMYGWDNEYGNRTQWVAAFRAARLLVSNAEYHAFVADGGYQKPDLWTEEGRNWLAYSEAEHPTFWIPTASGGYRYRTLTSEIDMPWDWPVDVNQLEAAAFCRWKSQRTGQTIRLPTEAEHTRMRAVSGVADEPDWGDIAPGNINLEHGASACPVDRHVHGRFCDIIGNVWAWSATPIDAFDGFEPHPLYDDFSTPTFDGRHNIISGGSWISTGNEATQHARYAFRRHFFQHAGFRYIEAEPLAQAHNPASDYYETDSLLAQYCDFHYSRNHFGVPNFPKAVAEYALRQMHGLKHGHAIDIGCATGRSCFELAPHFETVTGVDYSARFIRLAQTLLDHGRLRYAIPTEGELTEDRSVTLEQLGLERADNIEFRQQDACNLKPNFTGYDLVLAINLIDRLYDPQGFLDEIATRMNPGARLVLASPYTWQEESTPKEKWIGGYRDANGRPITTFEALRILLARDFELVGEPEDIPFVIRETARKHQHTLSQISTWARR